MADDRPVVWPPFADDGPRLALTLPAQKQKETGHVFMNCPDVETVTKKGKKVLPCERCERVRAEIGRRAAAHQRAFDEQWYREHPEAKRAY